MTAAGPGGVLWGVVFLGMLAALLVVTVRSLTRTGPGSGRLIAIGVGVGLAVVAVGLAAAFLT